MLSTFSCSKLSMLNNSVKMEKDAARDFENKFFEAIEKKDGELLKSCFSEAALKDAADIDKGIEYVLSAYKDGRATRTDDNISSYTQFKKGESFHTINASRSVIRSSLSWYILIMPCVLSMQVRSAFSIRSSVSGNSMP